MGEVCNVTFTVEHRQQVFVGLPKVFSGTSIDVILDVGVCHPQRANVQFHSLVSTWTSSGSQRIQHPIQCKLMKATSQESHASNCTGMSHNVTEGREDVRHSRSQRSLNAKRWEGFWSDSHVVPCHRRLKNRSFVAFACSTKFPLGSKSLARDRKSAWKAPTNAP